MLRLYGTSSEDPGKVQCVFTLPKKLRGRTFVEIYSGDSHHHHSSAFYTRPEDRILIVSVKEAPLSDPSEHHTRITSIVVFVSTLLHLAQSRHLVGWEEWKQYTSVTDDQEAGSLINNRSFISSSRIINVSASPEQEGMMTLEVTAFRPSIIERSLYASGDVEPGRLICRKASYDVQTDDISKTEVMMSEDNIIMMTQLDGKCGAGSELSILTF